MIIVLYENMNNFILSFYDKMAKFYPESSRGKISSRDKAADVLARFTRPPLFSSGWLIDCHPKVSSSVLSKLESVSEKNIILIRVTTQRLLNDVCTKLQSLSVRFVNNYYLKYGDVIDWIQQELNCSTVIAEKVYDRTNGQLAKLVEAVNVLSTLNTINITDVNRYVAKVSIYSPYDLFLWIIGSPKHGMHKTDAVRVVYEYQYGITWLLKFLIGNVEECLTVFTYAMFGELSLKNYKQFRQVTSEKSISEMSEGKLKNILGLFGYVSYEFLFYLKNLLGSFKSDDFVCYRLVQLIKLNSTC